MGAVSRLPLCERQLAIRVFLGFILSMRLLRCSVNILADRQQKGEGIFYLKLVGAAFSPFDNIRAATHIELWHGPRAPIMHYFFRRNPPT
jgi:hypothetical protein